MARNKRLASASNSMCGSCSRKIKDKEEQAIQCDKCENWLHQKCTDVPLEALNLFDVVKGIKWFCDHCLNPVKQLMARNESMDEAVGIIKATISELKEDLNKAKYNSTSLITSNPTPPAPNENNLEIRVNGIKEYTRKKDANGKDIIATQDEILSHDSYEIEKVLNHLGEETNCIADLKRLGKFDKDKKRPRTILLRLNNTWTARKLLAKAKQLKNFEGATKVFISKSLNKEEQKIENKLLMKRRELINDGTTTKDIHIIGLKLYVNGHETKID